MFLEQLPDTLELMSRALQAGHAFSEALLMVSDEMPEPVATSPGWFGARLTWPLLLQRPATDKQLHAGIVEPKLTGPAAAVAQLPGGGRVTVTITIDGPKQPAG